MPSCIRYINIINIYKNAVYGVGRVSRVCPSLHTYITEAQVQCSTALGVRIHEGDTTMLITRYTSVLIKSTGNTMVSPTYVPPHSIARAEFSLATFHAPVAVCGGASLDLVSVTDVLSPSSVSDRAGQNEFSKTYQFPRPLIHLTAYSTEFGLCKSGFNFECEPRHRRSLSVETCNGISRNRYDDDHVQ
ncbi:Uncharacterized protein FWK35_00006145 [Aphis craccivora]|uniref:Uncharacterized protein n=1 Tax=Aphis craccivora TaxID=307492 RepID=A0A6G0ZJ38_APHCR|nr:Uncharacterized protein FWK35_00006145 [Aphis craccivora]